MLQVGCGCGGGHVQTVGSTGTTLPSHTVTHGIGVLDFSHQACGIEQLVGHQTLVGSVVEQNS